ncbi:MAG: DUF58 domain-containing protein [Planctomycetota bacterium]
MKGAARSQEQLAEDAARRLSLSDESRAEVQRWALRLDHAPRGGATGDVLGRGSGGSMEFHDRRSYSPGDDVRHIDWRALARTDEVLVRVHREEVSPRLDLFVDLSLSMSTDEAKARRALELTALLAESGRAAGHAVRLVGLGDEVQRIPLEVLMGEGLAFDGRRSLADQVGAAAAQVRPSSVRAVVSDFLVPMAPESMVRSLARGAARVLFVQVLSERDIGPREQGVVQLVDAESGELRDVSMDAAGVKRYRERLERLRSGLAGAVRGEGGVFLEASVERDLRAEAEALAALGAIEVGGR